METHQKCPLSYVNSMNQRTQQPKWYLSSIEKKWKYFEFTTSIALNIDNFLCPPNNTGLQLPSLPWALTAPVFLPFIEPFPVIHKYHLSQKPDKSKTNSSHSLTPLQLLSPVPHSLLTRSPTGQAPATPHPGAHHTPLAASTLPKLRDSTPGEALLFPAWLPCWGCLSLSKSFMCVQMLGFLMYQVQNSFLFFVFSL